MRVHSALLLLISSSSPVFGFREAHVGVLDFHLPLLGAPLTDFARTAPAFHVPSPSALSSQSDSSRRKIDLVYTASAGNVLAAIHSGNGTLAWRYAFAGGADQLISFFQHDEYIAALSGPGGATLRLFRASTGHLISETHLHAPEAGKLHAPDRGASVSFLPSSEGSSNTTPDLIVLTNGCEIRRLSSTGELKWAWTAEDHGAQILYTHLTATEEAIYSVGISKSFSSLQLFFLSLHPDTGAVQSTTPIPSAISDGVSDVIQLNHPETGPVLVWLEEGIIRNAGFVPQGLWSKPTAVKVGIFDRIVDVGLGRSHGIFLGITRSDGAARVIHLIANRNIISEHEFADSKISEDYAESQYVGGVDQLGRPYIARVYWSHVHKLINVHIYGPTLAGGQGILSGFTIPFDTSRGGIISAAAIAVTGPPAEEDEEKEKEVVLDAKVLVSTSTGAMQMWSPKRRLWTREEGLGEAIVRLVVDYPEEEVLSSTVQEEYNTTFVERLQRHVTQLSNLPNYLNAWARQFLAPSGAASLTTNVNGTSTTTVRDITGARKVILLATPYGGIYALDSSTGKIMWQKLLGLASGFGAAESSSTNAQVVPRKLIQLTTHDGKPNGVVLVALRKEAPSPQDPRGAIENFVFHFDERTGESRLPSLNKPNIAVLRDAGIEDSDEPEEPAPLLEGIRIGTPGAGIVDSFSITLNKRNVVLLVDEYQLAHLYPHTPENVAAFSKAGPEMFFPLRIGPSYGRKLGGYSFMARPLTPPDSEDAGAFSASLSAFRAYQAWTFSPPSGVDILSHTLVQHPKDRPLASWGKALGNRTTLYKYATGRMLGLILAGPGRGERPPSCEVAVLDGASGAVLYRRALPVAGGIVGTCDVKLAFTENWLVYTYFDPADDVARPVNGARGWRVVSVEMYEGGADRKTESTGLSARERKSAEVAAVEQAFVWGGEVGAMSMSETKFGISSKAVILAGTNGQILTLSRRMLDPRRPKRKVTAEEAEEGLVPYDAILPDDGPRVLSHRYNVLRINKIESSPAKLESTAVVCAFGLDIFCSRIAPSGTFDVLSEEFNKAQLVLTVLGLLGGILVARPIVRRKALRERWYA